MALAFLALAVFVFGAVLSSTPVMVGAAAVYAFARMRMFWVLPD